MSPHILEALIGGLLASIPSAAALLVYIGEQRRLKRDFPPHRHDNGLIVYPKGYEPPEVHKLVTR